MVARWRALEVTRLCSFCPRCAVVVAQEEYKRREEEKLAAVEERRALVKARHVQKMEVLGMHARVKQYVDSLPALLLLLFAGVWAHAVCAVACVATQGSCRSATGA